MTGTTPHPAQTVRGPAGAALIDPIRGRVLDFDRPWSLSDGATRWPVVAGIPYLRVGREAPRRTALEALDAGDEPAALAVLLADQDDYARTPPPTAATLRDLVDAVDADAVSLRDAMAALNYGPVTDYFAHRWSAPTFLSGLALLALRPADRPVVEVACGIGHYLRELARQGVECGGIDVVFSKLWLARRFLVGSGVPLVCGDAAAGWPLGRAAGPSVAFCHDAFYFLPEKPKVLAAMHTLAGEGGSILIGHAHNRLRDHGGVSGEPKTPAEYAAMLPGCMLFDDAELARSVWSGSIALPQTAAELADREAVALVWPAGQDSNVSNSDLTHPKFRLNPMLRDDAGTLRPDWPTPRFEAEYAAESAYLIGEPTPSAETLRRAAQGVADPEVNRLARRRIVLDLPERW